MNIELKDYFAGQALQGLLANGTGIEINHLVMTSYHIADKMIQHKNESEGLHHIVNSKQIENTL